MIKLKHIVEDSSGMPRADIFIHQNKILTIFDIKERKTFDSLYKKKIKIR